jgi:hypothetical protein
MQQVELRVELVGFDSSTALVWTPSAGSVDENRVFTAPDQAGTVTITVAVEDRPEFQDSIEIPIGGCSCQASINVGGEAVSTIRMDYTLSGDLSGIQAFGWRGEGLASATFGFGSDPFNSAVIPFGFAADTEALVSGQTNTVQFFNPLDPNDPQVSPLTLVVDEASGAVFAGTVSGAVRVPDDPEPYTTNLTLTFRIEADPFLSDDDVKRCEVTVN